MRPDPLHSFEDHETGYLEEGQLGQAVARASEEHQQQARYRRDGDREPGAVTGRSEQLAPVVDVGGREHEGELVGAEEPGEGQAN